MAVLRQEVLCFVCIYLFRWVFFPDDFADPSPPPPKKQKKGEKTEKSRDNRKTSKAPSPDKKTTRQNRFVSIMTLTVMKKCESV